MKGMMRMAKTFWDKVSPLYDFNEIFFNGDVYENMIYEACSYISSDMEVLEIGGGTGAISLAAADIAKLVVCTDLSTDMLRRAFVKAKRTGLSNVRFKTCSAVQLPFRDDRFDCVIAANIIHLLEDPSKAITEAMRVLKPGGKLLLPNFATDQSGAASKVLIKLYRAIGFAPKRTFTPESYEDFLKNCGLENIRMRVIYGNVPLCFAVTEKQKEG